MCAGWGGVHAVDDALHDRQDNVSKQSDMDIYICTWTPRPLVPRGSWDGSLLKANTHGSFTNFYEGSRDECFQTSGALATRLYVAFRSKHDQASPLRHGRRNAKRYQRLLCSFLTLAAQRRSERLKRVGTYTR